ncbi:endoplasmic reticulum-Golgi intermediate compartment protein 2 isoform X2 [Cimex lectularius]|uniref:Endoplasmic reticulum-Golgi intermediate compartment protein 2 n=1 Tax=Cimex lectularius TaxID=79782 RepID=A0A8I6RMN0_CIMLE|nr:endoplasmic reticulum-Golgi intermediate compartment protein 2 isoform X2 [Cimex lectularius]
MILRNRKKLPAVEIIKKLDYFPKVNKDDYVKRSKVGGVVTVLVYFAPDTEFDAKLNVNLDITVATPCHSVGADILDSTNQNVMLFGTLQEEDTWFDMSEEQKSHFQDIRYFNNYLQNEFHEIHELLWKSGHSFMPTGLPKRKETPNYNPDACRLFGSLELNKVAGNLHITAGKSFPLPDGGHIHVPLFIDKSSFNCSHRIHHFSFGNSIVGIINPLDGDEKITQDYMTLYQYFIEIVPTDVETFLSKAKTYQYSVKENKRLINHDSGSHGIPGIYFKYDFSALKVTVTQSREPLLQFLIRLFSTIAGVFITAGFLCNLVHLLLAKFGMTQTEEESIKLLSQSLEYDKIVI